VCPAVAGAANWPSTAFHPTTCLFYVFAEESCDIYSKNDQWWEAGKSFYGGGTRGAPRDGGREIPQSSGYSDRKDRLGDSGCGRRDSGERPDGDRGRLVFYGDGRGAFVAADAKSGKLL
jgi:hypothetical protein